MFLVSMANHRKPRKFVLRYATQEISSDSYSVPQGLSRVLKKDEAEIDTCGTCDDFNSLPFVSFFSSQ